MLERCLLDTNILSYLVETENEAVRQHARRHLNLYQTLYIPMISYFEVLRSWMFLATSHTAATRANARRKIYLFEEFCHANELMPLSVDACRFAAESYVAVRRMETGRLMSHDILIAGIALANDMVVATENSADFDLIPNLKTTNWLHQ